MRTTLVLGLGILPSLLLGCGGDGDIGAEESDLTKVVKDGSPEALAVLALVNDRNVLSPELDNAAKTSKAAAVNIVAHREGADGEQRTDDDDLFDNIKELDDIKSVGDATFKQLLAYATQKGYLADEKAKELDVVFSPKPLAQSHNAKIAKTIDEAEESIDIAMYSFSDAGISSALEKAVDRGVRVRFIFDQGSIDKTGNLLTTKAGKLEALGADVRYVNKIMHHKWMIMDGPRDDAGRAKTATIVSGSGNWSNGAATKYDENTLFMKGYPELALRMQREFNLMWEHTKDFVAVPMTFQSSSLLVEDVTIPENPGVDALFTSGNFKVKDTTFSVTGTSVLSDQLVEAILGAEDRIYVASGHLRSRPVAEALIQKRAEDPNIEIKVYADGQEYISQTTHNIQLSDLDKCLAAATTASQKNKCVQKGFLFGLQVGQAGIDVRYKYYAYRWDLSYALQMHHKFLLIDDTLFTGSYNLSDNAEQNTFENMLVFRGPEFKGLRETFEDHFLSMWETGEGKLTGLNAQITSGQTFPIVFEPMALTWEEVNGLKTLIKQNCPQVDSEQFRTNAAAHTVCQK